MRVKKLPKILALHLKRFKYMEQLNRFTKLSHRVLFTFELRLFETVSLIVICLYDFASMVIYMYMKIDNIWTYFVIYKQLSTLYSF